MPGVSRTVTGIPSMQRRLRMVRDALGSPPNIVNVRVRPARADGADNTEIVKAFKTGAYGKHGHVGKRDFWEITPGLARRLKIQLDVQFARKVARWESGQSAPDKRGVLLKIGFVMLRVIQSRIGGARPKPPDAALSSPFPDLTESYKDRKAEAKLHTLSKTKIKRFMGVRLVRGIAGQKTSAVHSGVSVYPVGVLTGELLRSHYVEVE